MCIRIIVTGGTFDKHYDEIRGELTFKNSHLPKILEQARVTSCTVQETIHLIDSLHMTNEHRERILSACRQAEETGIVIIHGTPVGSSRVGQNDCAHRRHDSLCGQWVRFAVQPGI